MANIRKSRFTDKQIIGFVKQAKAGLAVAKSYRNGGFSEATFYKRRTNVVGIFPNDASIVRLVGAMMLEQPA